MAAPKTVVVRTPSEEDVESKPPQLMTRNKTMAQLRRPTADFEESLYKDDTRVPAAAYIQEWGAVSRGPSTRQSALMERFPHHSVYGRGQARGAGLGTINGVLLPCLQNIFGVMMFIRLSWLIGVAGWMQATGIVLLCATSTFLTALSMSAIATNGLIPSGGPYYVISRGLGPEVGGAVGMLFYFGTTIAGAMYVVGAIEIFVVYLLPQASIFGDADADPTAKVNATRMYGSALLLLVTIIVFVGMKYVVRTAIPIFICVMLSILSVFIGVIVGGHGNKFDVCVIGKRLVSKDFAAGDCSPENMRLRSYFCMMPEGGISDMCDPYFSAAASSTPGQDGGFQMISGITPSSKEGIKENMQTKYAERSREFLTLHFERADSLNFGNDPANAFVQADMIPSFAILIAIFFPSVTGMMAGCNRSGDLKDPSNSIPKGTLSAICFTTVVYLCWVFMLSATVKGVVLIDKFGRSLGSQLLVALLAWPNRWILLVGALLSTIGAALQSLVGAPKLLAAIADDNTIPYLNKLKPSTPGGAPRRALIMTWFLCQLTVLIGDVDDITPLLSAFFLMCYLSVNLSCAVQGIQNHPNWRPRFKFYHWSISILGAIVCFTVMILSSWVYTIVAFTCAVIIVKLIDYHGAQVEWGHALRGVNLTSAHYTLLQEEGRIIYPKNWRPTLLVLVDAETSDNSFSIPTLFSLISGLKSRSGIAMVGYVLHGEPHMMSLETDQTKQFLRAAMGAVKLKGFVKVVASLDLGEAFSVMVQSIGLATLSPNTIVICMPIRARYKRKKLRMFWPGYVAAIRTAIHCGKAVLVIKGVDDMSGAQSSLSVHTTLDVWWIFNDGGILLLLPYLLRQHRSWSFTSIRLFTIARPQDNSVAMKKNLDAFVYQLRIPATVEVVEVQESDLAAYAVERTMALEERRQLLRGMQLNVEEQDMDVVSLLDASRLGDSVISKSPRASSGPTTPTTRSVHADERLDLMHTAVKLNAIMQQKSKTCRLLFVNLPCGPSDSVTPDDYLEMLEALTEKFPRAILVYGSGKEVVTLYS